MYACTCINILIKSRAGGGAAPLSPPPPLSCPWVCSIYSVDEGEDLSIDSPYRVSVFANGIVGWVPGYKWRTGCKVQLKYFPFDTQNCSILFNGWMYNVSWFLQYNNLTSTAP